jgi:hypothetical protein
MSESKRYTVQYQPKGYTCWQELQQFDSLEEARIFIGCWQRDVPTQPLRIKDNHMWVGPKFVSNTKKNETAKTQD